MLRYKVEWRHETPELTKIDLRSAPEGYYDSPEEAINAEILKTKRKLHIANTREAITSLGVLSLADELAAEEKKDGD